MMLILIGYSSRIKMPFGFPAGLLAVLLGTAIAWLLRLSGHNFFQPSAAPFEPHFYLFTPAISDLVSSLFSPNGWRFLAVIFPMGLFTVIGSLQNLESAEAAGDFYETRSSLLANGIATLFAAC